MEIVAPLESERPVEIWRMDEEDAITRMKALSELCMDFDVKYRDNRFREPYEVTAYLGTMFEGTKWRVVEKEEDGTEK